MSTITSGTINGIFTDYSVNSDNTINRVGDSNHPAYDNHTIARWGVPLFKDYDAPTQILYWHITYQE